MDWNKLLSAKRLNETDSSGLTRDRSDYERDFDRVVFSSAFRRLQDKTQVIPLPESDFVHSRLTHSLEVSCVGRSLGKIIGEKVIKKYALENIAPADFGAIVAAACLAHDIGNPPFGHSGESAISAYFKHGKGAALETQINNPAQWNDVTNFEGNANGFRILTNSTSGGSIKLTYTTLATFTKYPCHSTKAGETLNARASQKKYGYFQSEKEVFDEIATSLGLQKLGDGRWCRHPLAFLVEAADDICYRIIDFEDGVRIGLVPFAQAEKLLISILPHFEKSQPRYDAIKDTKEKLSYLRAKVIYELIYKAAKEFWRNEEAILAGQYDKHLTDEIDCVDTLEIIKDLSVNLVYNSRNVILIEASGFNVVGELLELFITAVNDFHEHGSKIRKEKPFSSKLIALLPKQYLASDEKPDKDLYMRVMQICEFLSGMTDTYAINLYKRLKGIQLPRE